MTNEKKGDENNKIGEQIAQKNTLFGYSSSNYLLKK